MSLVDLFLRYLVPVLYAFVVCAVLDLIRRILRFKISSMSISPFVQEDSLGRPRRIIRQQPEKDELTDINRIESFRLRCDDQHSSPLFSVLPGEVRDIVYVYAFSDYEDLTKSYDVETCYRRPEYMGPRKTETALLRTCQAIYGEAWFLPWTQAQHTFFLTAGTRKPNKTTEPRQLARTLRLIEKLHPDIPARRKEVSSVQIFAQLYVLEPGQSLNRVLQVPHFSPRAITITLRHTDIWDWEQDVPIHIKSPWVSRCRFPASVTNLRIQIESIERRKPQVDYVANKAREDWHFTRTDNVHLVCDAQTRLEELRWTGSSTWEGLRWIRDEDDREPGILHYYLVTLQFKPANFVTDATGYEARKKKIIPARIDVPPEIAAKTHIPGAGGRYACLHARQAALAGVTKETPASEALRLWQEWPGNPENVRQRMRDNLARQRQAAQMQAAAQQQQQGQQQQGQPQ